MSPQNSHILIVEDEALTALALEALLEEDGYKVCCIVATGKDAIACAKEDNINLILMDIRLAGDIDGVEAAQKIRTFNPAPIIFMTGYATSERKAQVKAIPNTQFLVKPILYEQLQTVLNTYHYEEESRTFVRHNQPI